jgi:hypothetical protein
MSADLLLGRAEHNSKNGLGHWSTRELRIQFNVMQIEHVSTPFYYAVTDRIIQLKRSCACCNAIVGFSLIDDSGHHLVAIVVLVLAVSFGMRFDSSMPGTEPDNV